MPHRNIRTRTATLLCATLLLSALTGCASAAEVKVLSTIGMQSALEELAPKFEKATGHTLSFGWAVSAQLVKRVQAGEAVDVAVVTRQGLEGLTREGKTLTLPGADIASSVIAVAVKHGAVKPDIATPEAFKQSVLKASSIAFSDPAAGGSSGVFIGKLLERLGIAEQMKSRIKHPPPSGNSAGLVASGEVELAIQQQPELMTAAGVDIVGPLPAELNDVTTFSAGVSTGSTQRSAAEALIKFLHSPEATAVLKARGLTPIAVQ